MSNLNLDHLIYGKDKTDNIVSIEVEDDKAVLFIEKDGIVTEKIVSNRYWILSNKKITNKFVELKGSLHYRYGIQFTDKQEFTKARHIWRHHDIYSIYNQQEALMVKDGYRYFKGMKPQEVSILSFDLETTSLKVGSKSKVLIISNTLRKNNQIIKKTFEFTDFDSCGQMAEAWAAWVREVNPSIIVGHNILNFDLKYLYDSCRRDGTYLTLGRDGSEIYLSPRQVDFRVDGSRSMEVNRFRIFGREICDTYMLAMRYDSVDKKYETYGLKAIIEQEGLQKKDRTFYDAATIRDNYLIPEEWEKIKEYCKDDSDDALALFDLMVPASFFTNQSIPKTFSDMMLSATGAQINSMLVASYLQDMHSIPEKTDLTGMHIEGGISFAVPGIYKNLYKEDLKSAYPSQILRFKLYDEKKDPKAHFYHMVNYFANRRFDMKKKFKETGDVYYKQLDASNKIFINSSYGVTNTSGLNFNSPKIAAKITEETRKVIDLGLRWASGQGKDYWLQKFFDIVGKDEEASGILSIGEPIPLNIPSHNFLIGPTDTDSISFCKPDLSPFSEEEKIALHKELCSISPEFMEWEQDGGNDGVHDKCIAFKAKNYVLYNNGKRSIKGSALKSSKTERAIKDFHSEIIDAILNDQTNFQEIYEKYIKEALAVTDLKRWSSKKTISEKVLTSDRENEAKLRRAIEGSEYTEGDKVYVFYKKDKELCLVENFDGDYDETKLLKRLHDSSKIFDNVIDTKSRFINYSLKKNQEKLKDIK